MAISLISGPQAYAPAYNPMVFIFDSTEKNQEGFKYVVQLRLEDNTVVKEVRVNPRIGDGYCVFDAGKAIQSYLTNQRPDDQNVDATDSYVRYKVRVREEFVLEWVFDRWDRLPFVLGSILSGNIVLTGSTPHPWVPGDSINVVLDAPMVPPFIVPGIPGPKIVFAVINDFTIALPTISLVQDPPPGNAFSGVVYSNYKLDSPGGWTNFNDYVGINAAWPVQEFPSYTDADITLINTDENKDLLTNLPKIFTCTLESRILLNIPYTESVPPPYFIRFNRTDGGGDRITSLTLAPPVVAIGVGPGNLPSGGWAGGSGAITGSNLGYDFWIENISAQRISNIYHIDIDRYCTKYPVKEIMFLDRKGSLGSFYFKYNPQISTDIDRLQSTFPNGQYVSPLYEGGKKTLGVSLSEKMTLTTAWLSIEESIYFQELLSSPVAYILEDENLRSVIITNSSSELKKGLDNKNIRYTVDIEASNNNVINW